MFKPLPADPALLQKLQIRNRIASLTAFAFLILWPAINSYIGSTVILGSLAPADLAVLSLFFGFGVTALLIPASVFFFTHALRYKKLLAHLDTNPAVFAATEPAPSDLKKLRSKKTSAIVWHSITLVVPVLWSAAAIASNGHAEGLSVVMLLGFPLVIASLTGGLVMSAISINSYLTFKAQLRWAFPDAQNWSAASTSKTS